MSRALPSSGRLALPLSELLQTTATAVQAVRMGRSLTEVLAAVPEAARPGVQALSFHVLRWLGSATEVRRLLAPKPPPPQVDALLLTALALLWPGEKLPYAEHTLVDQAVSAARNKLPAAASFINAVLRRFLRESATLVPAVGQTLLGAHNHPPWWVQRLQQDWPDEWQALLAAAQTRPPMALRVNRRSSSGADYQRLLAQQGRAARLLQLAPGGDEAQEQTLLLNEPCPVQQLPGFAEGAVSVQDPAAQRAAHLLLAGLGGSSAAAGSVPATRLPRVLDACAAPGGKAAHLLELAELDLLALDSDATRLARVHDSLQRLHLSGTEAAGGSRVTVQLGDACQPAAWWDGQPFDAILLDAPCTASGIVRRHPDVRWLRRADDVDALVRIQARMLDALWPLLAPGGRLLYATCSVFKAEGLHQIDAFLQRQGAAAARLDPASPGHLLCTRDNAGRVLAAGDRAEHDGFYYALLHKPPILH